MANKKYTLYTERKDNLAEIAHRYFDAFTINQGIGYYKGTEEESAQIVIIGDDGDFLSVEMLAKAIRDANRQECVLVETQSISSCFI